MRCSKKILIILSGFACLQAGASMDAPTIILYRGFVTQVHCRGRLLLSSVGNPNLIQRQAFPKELGCGVLLQPRADAGTSDLLLKTTGGDFHVLVTIQNKTAPTSSLDLEIHLETTQQGGFIR